MALAGRLLVMQPVLNLAAVRRSASTISGRSLPTTAAGLLTADLRAQLQRFRREQFIECLDIDFGALELRPGIFPVVVGVVRRMMSAGRPRSASNRAKASNGEPVSTPPKSQITASTMFLARSRLTATRRGRAPSSASPSMASYFSKWPSSNRLAPMRSPNPDVAGSNRRSVRLVIPSHQIEGRPLACQGNRMVWRSADKLCSLGGKHEGPKLWLDRNIPLPVFYSAIFSGQPETALLPTIKGIRQIQALCLGGEPINPDSDKLPLNSVIF